jgi:hypothetical protein
MRGQNQDYGMAKPFVKRDKCRDVEMATGLATPETPRRCLICRHFVWVWAKWAFIFLPWTLEFELYK